MASSCSAIVLRAPPIEAARQVANGDGSSTVSLVLAVDWQYPADDAAIVALSARNVLIVYRNGILPEALKLGLR